MFIHFFPQFFLKSLQITFNWRFLLFFLACFGKEKKEKNIWVDSFFFTSAAKQQQKINDTALACMRTCPPPPMAHINVSNKKLRKNELFSTHMLKKSVFVNN